MSQRSPGHAICLECGRLVVLTANYKLWTHVTQWFNRKPFERYCRGSDTPIGQRVVLHGPLNRNWIKSRYGRDSREMAQLNAETVEAQKLYWANRLDYPL
jgi:hypothetical protein